MTDHPLVITSGVALSTDRSRTGLVEIDWDGGAGTVTRAGTGAGIDDLVATAARSDWLGLDVPLGWPQAFVALLSGQGNGFRAPDDASLDRWRTDLSHRLTDRRVGEAADASGFPVRPPSVPEQGARAMDASVVLARLAAAGMPVDRTGRHGPVVEVHPAASLAQWGIRPGGTSGPEGTERRGEILVELEDRAELDVAGRQDACLTGSHLFDALVAALTVRAHALGLTVQPSVVVRERVAREGWIVLPDRVPAGAALWTAAAVRA